MRGPIRKEEIKKLIQSGFDIELISFELDIPIEQVIQCKEEIDRAEVHFKIELMKERYKKMFFRSDKAKIKVPKQLSQQEFELIERVRTTTENRIQEMKTLPKEEKRKIAIDILGELKNIEEYDLPIEEAEKLNTLINSEEFDSLRISIVDKIDYYINRAKKTIATQFAKAIEFKQYEVDDIDELKVLERKISAEMIKQNTVLIGAIKSKISSKVQNIQQQQAIDRLRYDISTSIESIITDLVNGNVDMQKANVIIDEEAKKRVESNPKTSFVLTEEQERKQILFQIRTTIRRNADQYPIQNPETMMFQLQELCGGDLVMNARAVVENLIARKDFETAKSICDKFYSKYKDKEKVKYIIDLKDEVRNAEIRDSVLKIINTEATIEEEIACLELIEKCLRMGNTKLRSISLGKNIDGLRSITLADIWSDEHQKDEISNSR